MKKFQYFLLLVLFALPLKSFAQPFVQFTAQSTTVDCATSTLSIDIDVADFIQMNAFDYSFHWDPTVLTLTSIDDLGIIPSIVIGQNGAATGGLTFSWFSVIAGGNTIPDATMVTLNFDIIGNASQTSGFTFDDIPTFINIAQYGMSLDDTQYTLTDGSLTITDTTDPTITCPTGPLTFDTGGTTTTQITGATPTANDNCAIDFISYDLTGATTGTGTGDVSNNVDFEIGTTTVTYTANDFGGNTETCFFDIVVTNNTAPTMMTVGIDNNLQVNCESSTASINVYVADFDNIRGGQFTITWPVATLQYIDTSNYAITVGNTAIGTANISNGQLVYSWNHSDEISLPDGILFTLEFNVSSPAGVTIPITFVPGSDEFTNNASTVFPFLPIDPSEYSMVDGSIYMFDNVAPSIICPVDITVNSTNGTDAVVNGIAPTAADNCGIMDTTYILTDLATSNNIGNGTGDASGIIFPVGTTIVEYTITDFDGNEEMCDLAITVQVPGAITVSVDSIQVNCETGTAMIGLPVQNFIDVIGFQFTIEWDPTELDFASIVEDNFAPNGIPGLGQVGSGSFNFSWFDISNPTTFADGDNALVLEFNILDQTVGNDYDFNFVSTPVPFEVSTITSTPDPTAISVPGNIEIIDDTDPVITCPTDVTVNSNGATSVVVNNIGATATDNCGTPTINYVILGTPPTVGTGDASGNSFFVGTTMVTYTTTDQGSNSANCSFNVTVIADQLMIDCPMDVNQSTDANVCSATLDLPVTILSDPNNVNTINWNITGTAGPAFGAGNITNFPFDIGTSTVTYTVTDNFGASETCSFEVTITDQEGPVISGIPADTTVECDNVPSAAVLTALDQCDGATNVNLISESVVAGPTPGSSIITRTWSTVDAAGNISIANQTITVIDTTAPTMTCPADITANSTTSPICGANISWTIPSASDNCDLNVQVTSTFTPNDFFPLGTTVVTYYAEDNAGNIDSCKFNVIISDVEDPMFSNCPTNVTIPAGINCDTIYTWVEPTVTDNCDNNVSVVVSPALGSAFMIGTTTVTYTATDASGNTESCSFDITVADMELPLITNCPTNMTIPAGINCDTIVTWIEPTITDNCDNNVSVVAFPSSGTTFMIGTTTVTYTAIDASGNLSSCSFDITVVDSDGPVFSNCPTNMTVPAGINCDTIVTWVEPTITDNCDNNVSVVVSPPLGSTFTSGTTIVTYTAIDASGNISNCSFDVTVADVDGPVFSNCPTDMTIPSGFACDTIVNWVEPTITDNCDNNVSVFVFPSLGTSFMIGTTTVTYTAIDASGNVSICSFDITVTDTEAPVISNCPMDITISSGVACDTIVTWVEPTFTDNCDNNNVNVVVSPPLGTAFTSGITTITYTATDVSGNISNCSFDITVADTEAPILTSCPTDMVIPSGGNCSASVVWNMPTATDNCDPNPTITCNIPSGNTFSVGTTPIICTVTDASGNESTCTFNITIVDEEAPSVFCPANVSVSTSGNINMDPNNLITSITPVGCDSVILTFDIPAGNDNCGIPTVTQSLGLPSGSTFGIGQNIIQFTATDGSGNVNTVLCETVITVTSFVGLNVTAFPDTVCTDGSTQLLADPFTSVPGATYTWSGPNPARMIPDVANPFLDNLALTDAGTYIVTVTDPATNCTSIDSVAVVVSQGPELAFIANTTNCVDPNGVTDIPLSVQVTNAVTVDSFIWTNPAGTVFSNDQNTLIFSATEAAAGLYCVEVFEVDGCSNTICETIQITNIPDAPIIVSDCGEYVCAGESCTLTGVSIPVDSMVWTATGNDPGLPADVNQSEIIITPGQNGFNLYTYTIFNNGCESSSSEGVIVSSPANVEPDLITVELNTAINDFTVINNDLIPGSLPGIFSINVTSDVSNGILVNNGDGTFDYTPDNGFIGDDQFIYEICLDCGEEEVCRWAIVTLSIETDECIIPTVISPNGDGMNDTWEISCVKNSPDNEVVILNRWGDEVYRAAPYNNDWEGTYNNEDLPDGTYFYIFKTSANDPNPFKGTVNIYR